MLYHMKMAQLEFGPNPKFTGTGKVKYSAYVSSPGGDTQTRVNGTFDAQAVLDPQAGVLHVSFTLPRRFANRLLGARIHDVEGLNYHIEDGLKFNITAPLKLNYATDIKNLATVKLYGHMASDADEPDMDTVWRVNGVEYGGYFDYYMGDDREPQAAIESMLSESSIIFKFDQQSLNNLAVWLDYVYEHHTPQDTPQQTEPKESPDALPPENGTNRVW